LNPQDESLKRGYSGIMQKRSSKGDFAQNALRVVEISTGEPLTKKKNAAAVALGRRGGLKGGIARREKLSPERRREIASAAARKRWEQERQKF
jgi:hypothetical protein